MHTFARVSSLVARGALVAASVCFAQAASGQQVQRPVDPQTYSSPSGTFTLTVDPSDIYGRGGATYQVAKHGKEMWAKPFPFTLFAAAITDGGIAAGYGYTRGERGGEEQKGETWPGDLVVAIFDHSGSLRLKELIKRSPGGPKPAFVLANGQIYDVTNSRPQDSGALPSPFALGLLIDEASDRFVVRLEDRRRYEIWRTYQLSTGTFLEKRTPWFWMKDAEGSVSIRDARLIRGTPLVLLECWQAVANRERKVLFRLVDLAAKPVWSFVGADERAVKEFNPDLARLLSWLNTHGRILRSDVPRQWDLFLSAQSRSVHGPARLSSSKSESKVQDQAGDTRVTFAVERTASGGWTVREVTRVSFVLPADEAKVERPLKELGTIVLGAGRTTDRTTPSTEVGRFAAITIDRRGRFIAVDARNGSISIFDAAGKLLSVGPRTPAAVQVESPELATDDNCNVFLGLEASDKPNGKRPYAHFSADGQRLQDVLLPAPRCAFQPGTGLVVALKQSEVCLINGSGKIVRTMQRRPDQCWLQHPRGVAVAPDGSLAVFARRLVGTETTVSLYKTNGDPVATIRLPESAGGFPKAAYDGRRLVVAGDNALLIYDAAGKQLASAEPPLEIPDGAFSYPLILPGGRELALYGGGKPVLHRFELP